LVLILLASGGILACGGNLMRGYFGMGIFHSKHEINIGTLWRHAYMYGASFIFTIGARYKTQSSDTLKTPKHIPMYHYSDVDVFMESRPYDCPLVCVELSDESISLPDFTHPERAIYLLGAEDHGLPESVLDRAQYIVQIPPSHSMNVAVAGTLVMYDRFLKSRRLV
jgi:tRNA G18 (ribose-2'-O)-methylase SpoU